MHMIFGNSCIGDAYFIGSFAEIMSFQLKQTTVRIDACLTIPHQVIHILANAYDFL